MQNRHNDMHVFMATQRKKWQGLQADSAKCTETYFYLLISLQRSSSVARGAYLQQAQSQIQKYKNIYQGINNLEPPQTNKPGLS